VFFASARAERAPDLIEDAAWRRGTPARFYQGAPPVGARLSVLREEDDLLDQGAEFPDSRPSSRMAMHSVGDVGV